MSSYEELHLNLNISAYRLRDKLADRSRKKRSIQETHFKLAIVEGSCCWKAYSAKRGGSFTQMSGANRYEPGFPIRSIELLEPEKCTCS